MKTDTNFWCELKGSIVTLLDLAGSGSIYQPELVGEDLYSEPFILPRGLLGGQVNVPNNCRMIVWGRNGFCDTFKPGVHSLRSCPPGRLNGRLVDISQHSYPLKLDNLHTKDLAKVSLQIDVEFKVDDPQALVQIKSPLQTMTQMVESTVRQVFENQLHLSLFGGTNSAQLTNKPALERQIRQALHTEEALKGLRILSLKIIKVEGDPIHLDLVTKEVLAEQQLRAEETVLQTRQQLAQSERELILFQAETEQLASSTREKVELDKAERQASIFESESDRREYQREKEERLWTHEQRMARIEALSRIVEAWGDPRSPGFVNGPYAQTINTNDQGQNVTKIIDHLLDPQEIRVSVRSNGHGSNGHGKPSTERKNGVVVTEEK